MLRDKKKPAQSSLSSRIALAVLLLYHAMYPWLRGLRAAYSTAYFLVHNVRTHCKYSSFYKITAYIRYIVLQHSQQFYSTAVVVSFAHFVRPLGAVCPIMSLHTLGYLRSSVGALEISHFLVYLTHPQNLFLLKVLLLGANITFLQAP
jgi:hypothetical protein